MRVQKIMNENESIKLFFRHQASIRRHFMTHAFAFISLISFYPTLQHGLLFITVVWVKDCRRHKFNIIIQNERERENWERAFPNCINFFSLYTRNTFVVVPFLFGIFWFTPLICFCFHSDSFSSFSFLLSFAHSRLRRKFLKMLDRRKSIEKKTVEDAMIKWRH